jgi:hypothetical protein
VVDGYGNLTPLVENPTPCLAEIISSAFPRGGLDLRPQKYNARVPNVVRGGAAVICTASEASCCPGLKLQFES